MVEVELHDDSDPENMNGHQDGDEEATSHDELDYNKLTRKQIEEELERRNIPDVFANKKDAVAVLKKVIARDLQHKHGERNARESHKTDETNGSEKSSEEIHVDRISGNPVQVKFPRVELPKFNSGQPPKDFIQKFEQLALMTGIEEQKMIQMFWINLEKEGELWYRNNRKYLQNLKDWGKIKAEFLEEFETPENLGSNWATFQNRKQGAAEPSAAYIENKIHLAEKIRHKLSEEELIDCIIRGFLPNLARQIFLMDNPSIKTMKKNVKRIEGSFMVNDDTSSSTAATQNTAKVVEEIIMQKLKELGIKPGVNTSEKPVNVIARNEEFHRNRSRDRSSDRDYRRYDNYPEERRGRYRNRSISKDRDTEERYRDRHHSRRDRSNSRGYDRRNWDSSRDREYHREQGRGYSPRKYRRDEYARSFSRDAYPSDSRRDDYFAERSRREGYHQDRRSHYDRDESTEKHGRRYSGDRRSSDRYRNSRDRSSTPGRRNSSRSPSGRIICDYCGRIGHYERTCYKKAYERQQDQKN